jgi:Methyltransferase domain.
MTNASTTGREAREIAFWTESESERPGVFSLDLLTHKLSEARIFLEKLATFGALFDESHTIVELGGGQCWASCIVKDRVGNRATVIGTDIAPDAVASVGEWERVIQVHLDRTESCRSYDTPFADDSVDLVFTFAAAHHFGAHRRTLAEIARILKPGGHALYLHEPSCKDWIYRLALKRVLAKRPVVPEDVLRYEHIRDLAHEAGLDTTVHFAPTTTYRGPTETVYYLAMQKLPILNKVLPCTVDLVFTKPSSSGG